MLQRLLQGASSNQAPAVQNLPSGGQDAQAAATNTGCAGPQMGGDTMSALMSLQGGQPAVSSSDVARQLISGLDTNGDGAVSLDEIQQALSNAGQNADASQAFASVDKNGDGKLSTDELTSALDQLQQSHGHHRHHGAERAAQEITSSIDSNGDGQLSLDEVTSALGSSNSDSASNIAQGFSALDTNGDGKLSADELASAIRTQMETALKAYTSQASQQQSASVASI
jgi:Ca2+-binding EF-hand superfamily protein